MESLKDELLSCCRCGERIEPGIETEIGPAARLGLSLSEQFFVESKFKGPLCIPCTNQLKTSYRILNGDYNVPSQERVNQ